VRVWFGLYQTLRARPGMSIRPLVYMLVLWLLPLLAVAPLFSRDVFSYAAQGEMMSHGINPYHYGPGILGSAGPYTSGVDPLWANTAAPYGPLFLMLAGWSASLSLHHALVTVVLLRLQSVVGIALIAYCIPKLARSFGHDAGPAFVLAVLNPLTLLALVGGAHNDAIMVGLLLAGVTAARARHPVWGVVLCALAASIKVPAAIGIVYVAWDWAGAGADWRRRTRMVLRSGLITVAVMGALSFVSGLGWGWLANLGTPGTVRSWMAPATGFGLLMSGSAHVLGMVADQMPTSSPGRVWLRFLGRDTAFFPGPAELARAGGYRVYFLTQRRLRPGHYEAHCEPLNAPGEVLDVPTLTARYAARLETHVRAYPADWAWTHRRWKLQRPAVAAAPARAGSR